MALGSCYTCIKYLMFGFNFIFWLLGCAILGVGIWLRVDESATDFVAQSSKMDSLYTVAYVMMAIGFLIMLIGFLGCCGAIRESQCMLATFFLFLFIIFATLLGFGIWAVVAKGSFESMTEDMVKEGVENYHKKKVSEAFMDSVQTTFDCCGATKGKMDYGVVKDIPTSCRKDDYQKLKCCGATRGEVDYANDMEGAPDSCKGYESKPCAKPLYRWVEDKLIIVAGVSIGIAVILILGMVFSIVLCCAIRDSVA